MWYYIFIPTCMIYALLQFIPSDVPPGIPWFRFIKFFTNTHEAVSQYIQKYGTIFTIPFPFGSWHFVMDKPLVAELLKADPEELSYVEALKGIVDGPFESLDGEFNLTDFNEYKRLIHGAFGKNSQNLTSLYLDWMKEICIENIKPGKIDIFKFTKRILMLINMRVIFGKKLANSLSNTDIEDDTDFSVHPIKFPWVSSRSEMTRDKMNKFIYYYVSDVISGKEALEPDTYLAYLMKDDFVDEKRPKPDIITSYIINVILPSQVTTVSTSAWTIYNLCKRLDLVEKIRQQKDVDVCGNIIQAILLESASCYANLFLIRKVMKPYKLGKYIFPKDSYIVTMPNYLINSDKNVVWDPLNPKTNTIGWSPFGSDLHPCPGQYLVKYQYEALFETLYLNFNVKLLNDYDHFTWCENITASPMPNKPLIAKITKKKQD